ncbi:hypothetical protein GYMLUDRAFT_1012992 [Collybiopsis luxurians FD-317 M1]|uniref:Uncharacterized protein n=1 Tax=Collybiopsis luxurians FD-317 M1 TaxID=944289 RepID=A0A0D0CES8_9AGAR|nr:hypothetical protein GYMLUDRAFT_1012992 [Collybiopsis luxurians FD-317 M1]
MSLKRIPSPNSTLPTPPHKRPRRSNFDIERNLFELTFSESMKTTNISLSLPRRRRSAMLHLDLPSALQGKENTGVISCPSPQLLPKFDPVSGEQGASHHLLEHNPFEHSFSALSKTSIGTVKSSTVANSEGSKCPESFTEPSQLTCGEQQPKPIPSAEDTNSLVQLHGGIRGLLRSTDLTSISGL